MGKRKVKSKHFPLILLIPLLVIALSALQFTHSINALASEAQAKTNCPDWASVACSVSHPAAKKFNDTFSATPMTAWDHQYNITVEGYQGGALTVLCKMKPTEIDTTKSANCSAIVGSGVFAVVEHPLVNSTSGIYYDWWNCSPCRVQTTSEGGSYTFSFSNSDPSIFPGPFGGPGTVNGVATYKDGTSSFGGNSTHTITVELTTEYAYDLVTCAATSGKATNVLKGINDTSGLYWTDRATIAGSGTNQLVEETAISPSSLTKDNITATWSGNHGSLGCWGISGVNDSQPFDGPSFTSYSATGTTGPNVNITTTTPNDIVEAIVATQGNPTVTNGCWGLALKSSFAPTYASEDLLLGSKNATSARWTNGELCFSLSSSKPWEVIGEAVRPQIYSTSAYTTKGTLAPPLGVSARMRVTGDDSVWEAYGAGDSIVPAQTVYGWLSEWNASVLQRFISGYQIPDADVPSNSGNLTVQEFLNTAMSLCVSANPHCIMTPRLSLNEWDEGIFNITSLDLLHFPLSTGMQIVSLDDWSNFSYFHTPSQVAQMFQTLYAQGWQGVCVNEAGGYYPSLGYATCADIGVSSTGNTTAGWQPFPSEVSGVRNESNIKYTDLLIDFPHPMNTFAEDLNNSEELAILANLSSTAEATKYNYSAYMFPVEQGTPTGGPVWDSQTQPVCQGVSFYQDELLLSNGSAPVTCTLTQLVCVPSSVEVNSATQCTATVSDRFDGLPVPSGTVTFIDDPFGSGTFSNLTCTLDSGACSVTYTPNPGTEGPIVINGTYGGDASQVGSSGTFSLNATRRTTNASVVCAPNPNPVNAVANCKVTVTDTGFGTPLTPSGTVNFTTSASGTFSLNTCTLSGGSCTVEYTPDLGSEGLQNITALYGGDTDHFNSTGAFQLTAIQRDSSTFVNCTPHSTPVGAPTTCIASVTDTSSGTPSTPMGTVSFQDGPSGDGTFNSTTCVLNVGGNCAVTYTPSPGSEGQISINGTYSGDANHFGSFGAFNLTATLIPTITKVTCSPYRLPVNTNTTCTIVVTDGQGDPIVATGTVILYSNASGTFTPDSCPLSNGSCAGIYTPESVGVNSITANYTGDTNHAGSLGGFNLIVTLRTTSLSLNCAPDKFPVGNFTTCTATVSDTAGGSPITPVGSVGFTSSRSGSFNQTSCSLTESGGNSKCSVAYWPGSGSEGADELNATYSGDSYHSGSWGIASLNITDQMTAVTITCPILGSKDGMRKCTLTVTDKDYDQSLTPTGDVTFSSSGFGAFTSNDCAMSGAGATKQCGPLLTDTCTLSGSGQAASCYLYFEPGAAGKYIITGAYSGDVNHAAKTKSTSFVTKSYERLNPSSQNQNLGYSVLAKPAEPTFGASLMIFRFLTPRVTT